MKLPYSHDWVKGAFWWECIKCGHTTFGPDSKTTIQEIAPGRGHAIITFDKKPGPYYADPTEVGSRRLCKRRLGYRSFK